MCSMNYVYNIVSWTLLKNHNYFFIIIICVFCAVFALRAITKLTWERAVFRFGFLKYVHRIQIFMKLHDLFLILLLIRPSEYFFASFSTFESFQYFSVFSLIFILIYLIFDEKFPSVLLPLFCPCYLTNIWSVANIFEFLFTGKLSA